MSFLFGWVLSLLGGVLTIPFFTMFERKILSYAQLRKGPKKVSLVGILQPILDGVKLVIKEGGALSFSNWFLFFFFPLLTFFLMLSLYMFIPVFFSGYFLSFSLVMFLCVSGFKVYGLLGSGLASKSKYAFLGGLRGAAQSISYEVSMVLIFFFPAVFLKSLCFTEFLEEVKMKIFIFIFFLGGFVIGLCAETNRPPFDFAEGESELVSGFSVEYMAVPFVFLFLGEYGSILFMCTILVSMFFSVHYIFFYFLSLMWVAVVVWLRATFPRFRYDFLMEFCWKVLLSFFLLSLWLIFF